MQLVPSNLVIHIALFCGNSRSARGKHGSSLLQRACGTAARYSRRYCVLLSGWNSPWHVRHFLVSIDANEERLAVIVPPPRKVRSCFARKETRDQTQTTDIVLWQAPRPKRARFFCHLLRQAYLAWYHCVRKNEEYVGLNIATYTVLTFPIMVVQLRLCMCT